MNSGPERRAIARRVSIAALSALAVTSRGRAHQTVHIVQHSSLSPDRDRSSLAKRRPAATTSFHSTTTRNRMHSSRIRGRSLSVYASICRDQCSRTDLCARCDFHVVAAAYLDVAPVDAYASALLGCASDSVYAPPTRTLGAYVPETRVYVPQS